MKPQQFAPASVLHDDLVGTVAADFPDSMRDLLRHAGLGEQWLVVAIEVEGSYRASWGAVLAVPLPASGRYLDWVAYADRNGGMVPVRRFPLAHADLNAAVPDGVGLLSQLKRWSLRLCIREVDGLPLQVVVEE